MPSSETTKKKHPNRFHEAAAAEFFTCPKGHKLPHRRGKKGRCSPFDCCEAKGHAWAVVRQAEKQMVKETSAYADETQRLREMKDRMRAWNDAHALPALPPPPKSSSVHEYTKKRLDQVAPLLLEMKIRKALLDPSEAGLRQADDMLDRQGTTRNPQTANVSTGPVYIINFDPKRDSPYEKQNREELPAKAATAVLEGEYTDFDPARAGRADGVTEQKKEDSSGQGTDAAVERSTRDDD